MKWLKVGICIVIVIIIILVIALFSIRNYIKNDIVEIDELIEVEKRDKAGYDPETSPIENAKVEEVKDKTEYFVVKNILKTYFTYIDYIDSEYEQDGTGIDIVKSVLDDEYLQKNTLNNEQIKNTILKYKNEHFQIDKMYYQEKTARKSIYFVYVTLDYSRQIQLIVKTDAMPYAFSILPDDYIKEKQYNENSIDSMDVQDISNKSYNTYVYLRASDKDIIQEYLSKYEATILSDEQKAYDMLDVQYKQKRFGSFENYRQYIQNTGKNFTSLEVEQYALEENNGEEKAYRCKDQYGRIYIFEETEFMNYTVQLDDYTLENEAFNKVYKEAVNRDKGLLNCEKFFEMINMQDYAAAYNVLDNGFKTTYFPTQSAFEEFIKNQLFKYNKAEYLEYNNQITSIHGYKVKVTDATSENTNQIEFNIVMQLLEGTNFVMSFQIN